MDNLFTFILGVVFIVLGIMNRKGNISMLHSYHRSRVSEEDILPFGKLVGLGTIIIGISLMLMGALSFVSHTLQEEIYLFIGIGIMIVGLVAGLIISFYAMIKYNKGIF